MLNMPSVAPSTRADSVSPRVRVPIYLDYHASTPCDPRVVQAMLPYFVEIYGNPSSSHPSGQVAADAVAGARELVAKAIGALAGEIAFTSGATESNNLAVLGVARAAPARRRRVLTSAVEHKAVLGPVHALAREGFEVRVLPVESDGRIDLDALAELVDNTTAVVSVQAANNEIGTLQPIGEIAQVVHRAGAVFHCDAAQAVGRIPVDVLDWDVDLLSISGHKCYAPKGIGALYIRGGIRNAPLHPLVVGGGQEAEIRPGTLNVPGIVGLGRACELICEDLAAEATRIAHLRDRFEAILKRELQGVRRNGALGRRLPGNSSLTFPGIDAEAMLANLPDVILSTGSACVSGSMEPSHVLTAIGLSRTEARQTVRIGLGRFTSDAEIPVAAGRIVETVQQLRRIAS